ncbi:MAG: hypothetical protein REI95_01695 [Oxalicibacterium faecigallinarum]|uniref:hypothetical protein n=1 Tax=Oxalicibacterium faecigallinarum TaxID=573741 RepID=UPI001662A9C8|nr:hypothetical protein [Oxalicibacterium faecigallinarum]MDQ7968332.1 hypothetical protein [Oxalicibacterium faecigallinarum]
MTIQQAFDFGSGILCVLAVWRHSAAMNAFKQYEEFTHPGCLIRQDESLQQIFLNSI